MSLHPWPEIHAGDVVLVRDRHTDHQVQITVARTLPAVDGDGPGLIATTGTAYRHANYTASCSPQPQPFTPLLGILEQLSEGTVR
jgi:hypothetical protein